jgi:PAS domain S-box-containing protein
MKNLDLKNRVALFVMAIFLCSVFYFAWHQANNLKSDLQKVIFDQQYARVQYIANNIDEALKIRLYALNTLSEQISPEMLRQPQKMQAFLETQKSMSKIFTLGMYTISSEGKGIADFPVMDGRATADYTQREYFRDVLATEKPVIGKPVLGRFAKQPVLLIAVPVKDKTGKIAGVLVGANLIYGSDLFNEVQNSGPKQHDDIHIVSPKYKIIIASSDSRRSLQNIPVAGVNLMLDRYLQGYEGSGVTIDSKQMEVLSSGSHVASSGWVVYGSLPSAVAFAPVKAIQKDTYTDAVILSLLFAVAVALFLRQQLNPLKNSAVMIHKMVSSEDSPKTIPVKGPPEIRQLLESFNLLQQKIAEKDVARINAEKEQRESEDKYRILFDCAGDSIFINDSKAGILAANQQACKTLGYSQAEFLAMSATEVDSPEQSRFVPERIASLMEHGHVAFETVHKHKDGTLIPTDVSLTRITWDGHPAIMSICRNISERKQAESDRSTLEQQMLQAQKLESLGVLAGGIAHDFNNLLMAIMGNADLALMRLNPESPAVDNLKRIEQASARAQISLNRCLPIPAKENSSLSMSI